MPGLTILHGCRTVQLTKGMNSLVDEADWDWARRHKWQAQPSAQRTKQWSAVRVEQRDHVRTYIRLHTQVCGNSPTGQVDHRNGDSLDNRRENLRPCTHTENARNRHRTWGRSKYKGVYYEKSRGNWVARIKGGAGKRIKIGDYSSEEEAARAYDAAAIREHGEFAATNAEIFGQF